MYKYTLVSIDAWREPEGGWTWNDMFKIEEGIYLDESMLTPRKLCRLMRKWGYLNEYSKGRIRVDFAGTCGEIIEFQNKNTHKPVFALMEEA